ncbi:MAG: hypothetical protein JW819_02005, partial [Candidatus Krumholzibacteriota bacterium]|nr:hypothetical protein [Candidatus Krumholzibacteriota bacterium]
ALEAHLAACPECRRELAALRDLLARAAELPDAIPPSRDLWPGIAAAIGDGAAARRKRAPGEPRGIRRLFAPGGGRLAPVLAAAAVLAVVAVMVWRALVAPGPGEAPPRLAERILPAEAPVGMAVAVASLEAECRDGDIQLTDLARRNGASPCLVAMTAGMDEVDQAIATARAAWQQQPDDRLLAHRVLAAYRAKASLQRHALSARCRV